MKCLAVAVLFLMQLAFSAPVEANVSTFSVDLPEGYLTGILELFPEGKPVDSSLLDFNVDPNIHLFQEAELFVTFLHEGAGLNNRFGYFLYHDANGDGMIAPDEMHKTETIFPEVVAASEGGTLKAGDTVNLGKFPAGTNLGFFLNSRDFTSEWTFYTLDALNFDGHRHLAMRVTPDGENIALGIEDLPWARSDRDFNDILFSLTTEPKSALQEVIEEGNIPGAPTPSPAPFAPPSPSPSPAALPAIDPAAPKIFEIPAQQAAGPGLMLEGGGMMCGLSKNPEGGSAQFSLWMGATLLISYLAIRLMRI